MVRRSDGDWIGRVLEGMCRVDWVNLNCERSTSWNLRMKSEDIVSRSNLALSVRPWRSAFIVSDWIGDPSYRDANSPILARGKKDLQSEFAGRLPYQISSHSTDSQRTFLRRAQSGQMTSFSKAATRSLRKSISLIRVWLSSSACLTYLIASFKTSAFLVLFG